MASWKSKQSASSWISIVCQARGGRALGSDVPTRLIDPPDLGDSEFSHRLFRLGSRLAAGFPGLDELQASTFHRYRTPGNR